MRTAWIILCMAALGVGVVHLRSRQNGLRAEMYRLEARRVKVRRRLWNQQLRIGELDVTGPKLQRSRDWALDLLPPDEAPPASRVVRRD